MPGSLECSRVARAHRADTAKRIADPIARGIQRDIELPLESQRGIQPSEATKMPVSPSRVKWVQQSCASGIVSQISCHAFGRRDECIPDAIDYFPRRGIGAQGSIDDI